MKHLYLLLAFALTCCNTAQAAFTYATTHPANQPITQLETYKGGVYVGNTGQPFEVHRYDPLLDRTTHEHTMTSQGVNRIRKLNDKLYFLGWRSIGGAHSNDLLASRDASGRYITVTQNSFGWHGYARWLNLNDINSDGDGNIRIVGYAFNGGHRGCKLNCVSA